MQHHDIVLQARTWINTRFHHQGRLKGSTNKPGGVDCIGLIVGVVKELEFKSIIKGKNGKQLFLHDFDRTDYARDPQRNQLMQELNKHLIEIAFKDVQPGDILLFKLIKEPQHVAIVGDYVGGGLSIIHAYSPARKVCEHRLDEKWIKRIIGCYRFK